MLGHIKTLQKTMAGIIRAPQIIDGEKLRGTHPVTRSLLNSMTVRSLNPEELFRSLEAVGFDNANSITAATVMMVSGNADNEIKGSFLRLTGNPLCFNQFPSLLSIHL